MIYPKDAVAMLRAIPEGMRPILLRTFSQDTLETLYHELAREALSSTLKTSLEKTDFSGYSKRVMVNIVLDKLKES